MKIVWPLLALSVLSAACGTTAGTTAESVPDTPAIVVRGTDMSGTLLDGLRARVPTMRVRIERNTCPLITLRGHRSSQRQGNPSVYVDGTLMTDTCILQLIASSDVDFVEIFPGGATAPGATQRSPYGTIFVHRVRR
jgi:hypothetical protein